MTFVCFYGIICSMIKVGDRVKIVRVNPTAGMDDRVWLWAHGIEGTLTVINQSLPQIYYVKFPERICDHPTTLDIWDGLWCHEVECIFEDVVLPKELFEI